MTTKKGEAAIVKKDADKKDAAQFTAANIKIGNKEAQKAIKDALQHISGTILKFSFFWWAQNSDTKICFRFVRNVFVLSAILLIVL